VKQEHREAEKYFASSRFTKAYHTEIQGTLKFNEIQKLMAKLSEANENLSENDEGKKLAHTLRLNHWHALILSSLFSEAQAKMCIAPACIGNLAKMYRRERKRSKCIILNPFLWRNP